jgi:hypothetical protein
MGLRSSSGVAYDMTSGTVTATPTCPMHAAQEERLMADGYFSLRWPA